MVLGVTEKRYAKAGRGAYAELLQRQVPAFHFPHPNGIERKRTLFLLFDFNQVSLEFEAIGNPLGFFDALGAGDAAQGERSGGTGGNEIHGRTADGKYKNHWVSAAVGHPYANPNHWPGTRNLEKRLFPSGYPYPATFLSYAPGGCETEG